MELELTHLQNLLRFKNLGSRLDLVILRPTKKSYFVKVQNDLLPYEFRAVFKSLGPMMFLNFRINLTFALKYLTDGFKLES